MSKSDDEIPDDWWPSSLVEFANERLLSDEYVVVAEISNPWGDDSDKLLSTALVPVDRVEALSNHCGSIDYKVRTSGPWPARYQSQFDYAPTFWIGGIERDEDFEPLVIEWESSDRTILLPDQGFLMTYGLMPRYSESGEVSWDDLRNRVFDVVKVEPPSEFRYRLLTESRVLIRQEYLQDYAAVRNMSVIQVYFVANSTDMPDSISATLAQNSTGDITLPQRMVEIRFDARDKNRVLAQIWGYRHLLDPADAPVSDDDDYGNLDWLGYGTVDGRKGIRLRQLPRACEFVYVSDAVLGEYEGWPGFSIVPESGGVSYGGQWSVTHTSRLGRDLIQVELKKLYEGNHPNTVKTWHKYCVTPPTVADLSKLRRVPNIATRAKAVVYGLADLGEVLAEIASRVEGVTRTGKEVVGLDRDELDYYGWWKDDVIEPITRHAPLSMTEGDFMLRCVDLFKIVGEGFKEQILRKTLLGVGEDAKAIESFRCLKLLERLAQLACIADDTGLSLLTQGGEIVNRRKRAAPPTPLNSLFGLQGLRVSKSHRGAEAKSALKEFGICVAAMKPGWGPALDIVYDRITVSLQDITAALRVVTP